MFRILYFTMILLIFSCQTHFENKSVLQSRTVVKSETISQILPEEQKIDEPIISHKDTFPLNFIASSETEYIVNEKIEKNLQIGISGSKFFTVTGENFEHFGVFLSGKDRNRKNWEVDLSDRAIGLGYNSYIADFDNNGIKDFLFVTYTSANGFLPNTVFHFVMFESDGRPFPFFIPLSGQDIQISSIYPLMDTNKDGKAELVVQFYQYSKDGDKWKGHYITNVYQAENARWKKLGKFQNKRLPVSTFFETYQENSQYGVLIPISEKPRQKTTPFSPNWENFSAVLQARAQILPEEKDNFVFAFRADKNGKSYSVGRQGSDDCYLNTVLVSDSAEERKIKSIYQYGQYDKKIGEETNQAILKSKKVEFFGQCSPNKISPYLIWIYQ